MEASVIRELEERFGARPLGLVLDTNNFSAEPETPGLARRELELDNGKTRKRRMRKGVKLGAQYIEQQCLESGRDWYTAMITATYAANEVWEPEDISRLVRGVQKWAKKHWGITAMYVWVIETHKSGRPHYHLLVWIPEGHMLPMPDTVGWWTKGMTQIARANRPVGYLVKYASKADNGGDFPRGARISGVGGLNRINREKRKYHMQPGYVRDAHGLERVNGKLRAAVRVRGGGFAPVSKCRRVRVEKPGQKARNVWEVVRDADRVRSEWEFLEMREGQAVLRERRPVAAVVNRFASMGRMFNVVRDRLTGRRRIFEAETMREWRRCITGFEPVSGTAW